MPATMTASATVMPEVMPESSSVKSKSESLSSESGKTRLSFRRLLCRSLADCVWERLRVRAGCGVAELADRNGVETQSR